MSNELMGVILFAGGIAVLTVICFILNKFLSAITDRVLDKGTDSDSTEK